MTPSAVQCWSNPHSVMWASELTHICDQCAGGFIGGRVDRKKFNRARPAAIGPARDPASCVWARCAVTPTAAPLRLLKNTRISSIYISGRTWWILLLSNQICVFMHDWCGTWRRTCSCSRSVVKIKNPVAWRSSASPSVDNETGFSLLKPLK